MRQELLALAKERSKEHVCEFLDRFLPKRKPAADEYSFPELADQPDAVYENDLEALDHLTTHPEETYALYWNNRDRDQDIGQANAYFLEGGHMLLSLVVWERDADRYLQALREFAGTAYACLGDESRPDDSLEEFVRRCKG